MSYHIYRTPGFILTSTPAGESNRYYYIYTRDLGLVGVWGQGVRKLESKLRYNMQDFTEVSIQLIRGKNMWRLTDVESLRSYKNIRASYVKRQATADVARLMRRLADEGEDEGVYDLFSRYMERVDALEDRAHDVKAAELLFVVRLLQQLGYGNESLPKDVILDESWDDHMLEEVKQKRVMYVRAINSALHETQM